MLLQKNLSRKIARFFVSKIGPATGVKYHMYSCVSGLSLLIYYVFCKHGIDESLCMYRLFIYLFILI